MLLVYVTALLAVCGADKLDRKYLPPITAKTAGGGPDSLLPPYEKSSLPSGSYVNEDQGVVVNAVAAGTRSSEGESTGLGGRRPSYGSKDSKVGDAAFQANIATRIAPGFNVAILGKEKIDNANFRRLPGIIAPVLPKGADSTTSHVNTLKFTNEIGKEKYSYGFETENGIAVGENGISSDGINAHGEYSYKSDDGKVYSVSYTADKDGYKPKGNHLPTPPPIPKEIVTSLEENAKDEAAGILDDGSYDAQKYNNEGKLSTYNNYDSIKNQQSINDKASKSESHVLTPFRSDESGIFRFGDSSATAEVSTVGNRNNEKFSGIPRYFGRLPPSSVGDTAYSSATVTGFGSASASASTNSNNPTLVKKIDSNIHGTLEQFLDDSKLVKENKDVTQASVYSFPSILQAPTTQLKFKVNRIDSKSTQLPIGQAQPGFTGSRQIFSEDTGSQSGQRPSVQSHLEREPQTPLYQGTGTLYQYNKPSSSNDGSSSFSNKTPIDKNISQKNSTLQQNLGTIYEYEKPADKLSHDKEPSQENSPNLTQFNLSTQRKTELTSNFQTQSNTANVNVVSQIQQSSKFIKEPLSALSNLKNIEKNQFQFGTKTKPEVPITSQFGSQSSTGSFQTTQKNNFAVSQLSQTTGIKGQNTQQTKPQASIVSQFGSKPFRSESPLSSFQTTKNEKSTASQFGQTTGIKGQNGQQTTSFGKQPFGSPQNKDGSFTQTTFSSTFGSQYGQKPQSNLGTRVGGTPQAPIVSQFGSKPFGSQSALSTFQTSQNEKSSVSQFGQTTDIKGQTSQPSTDFVKQPFGSSLNKDSTFTQTTFSSRFGSQYGQKPQSNLGTSVGGTPQAPIVSQFGSKPFGSQSALGTFQTSQNEKSSVSQFGQSTGTKGQTAQQTIGFGKQPFDSSQNKDVSFTQSTFSSTFGSQYGQNPQSNLGTSVGGTPQAPSVSQFGSKPFGSQSALSTFQTSQNEKSSVSQFGQTTDIKGQTSQPSTDFGKQPYGSSLNKDSTFTQTTFSSRFGSQYGQKPQSNLGTSVGGTPQAPIVSQFGSKPFGSQSALSSFQTTQKEKSAVSHFGQSTGTKGQTAQQTIGFGKQPFGSSQNKDGSFTQSTFSSTFGSQYGQNPQSNLGTSVGGTPQAPIVSQFGSKPFGSKFALSKFQTSQNEKSTVSQFGHTTGVKGQIAQQSTGFNKQPLGSSQIKDSTFTQTTFNSTFGSQNGQNPQSNVDTGIGTTSQTPSVSQFGSKPFGSQSALSSFQTVQNEKSTVSQFGQTTDIKGQTSQPSTDFGKQPFGSLLNKDSTFTQSTFSSRFGSQYGQKPQSNLGTSVGSTPQAPIVSQFGSKPFGSQSALGTFQTSQNEKSSVSKFGQSTGTKGQTAQQTIGFGKQPFDSSQNKDGSFTQSTFSSTFGSQYGQNPQSNLGTSVGGTPQAPSVSQFGSKPFGSQSALSTFQTSQNEKSSVSQFGQTTDIKGQTSQPSTDFGKQPFGSSLNKDSTFTQTTFSSRFGSQYGQKPQSNLGTSVGGTPQAPIVSQFGSKPFGSQSALGTFQTSQNEKSSVSQFGQSTGTKGQTAQQTIGFGKQPFDSSQNKDGSFTQSTFSSTFGSQYGQNPQSNLGTSVGGTPQAPSVSQFGSKPFGSQSALSTFQTSQNEKSSVSQFGQTTDIKGQTSQPSTDFGKQPFGSSLNKDSTFTQTTFSSRFGSQYGQKPQSNLGTSVGGTPQAPIVSQFGSKPFGSQSALGTFQTSQNEKSSVSKFGQSTGTKGQTAQQTIGFGKQPFDSSQNKDGSFTQSTFSSTFGSQYGQNPQSNLGTSVGGTPQAPSVSQFGSKPFGSQSALSTFQTSQNEKSSVSQFGQTTDIKGRTSQPSTDFGEQPFGSSLNKDSTFTQTTFSSRFGSQYGQKPQSNLGTSVGGTPQAPIVSQFGSKPFGSQSALGTFQTSQNEKSSVSQFGQSTGTKGQTAQQTIGFGKQPFDSSQNKDGSFTQSTFSSTFGSQYGQNPQSNLDTSVGGTPQAPSVSQFGSKPFGSQSALSTFQTSQNEKSSVSQFGQTTDIKGQTSQPSTDIGKQPFGSSLNKDSTFTQTTFSSRFGSQYGQKPQSNLGTSVGGTPQAPIVSQFGSKPFGSQSALSSFQTTQKEKSAVSHFGQSTGTKGQTAQQTIGFGKQPFGSSQNKDGSFTQSTFSSTFGSQYGQNPQSNLGTSVGGTPQAPIVSQFGSKPFGSKFALSKFQTSQNEKSTVSQFGHTTGVKGQIAQQSTGFNKQPLGSSQIKDSTFTQTTFNSTFGSQYGQKPQSNVDTSIGTTSQTPSVSQFGSKPFGSQSALSSFQTVQNEKSTVSQFGQTTDIKGHTSQPSTDFGKQPFGSSLNKDSTFTQTTFSSRFGSQYGQKPQSNLGTSVGGTPQAPIVSQFGSKPFGSQSALSSFQTTQKEKSAVSHFGQSTGTKGQTAQQTIGFGKQPFGSSQNKDGSFTQSTFSSTFGSQYGQNPQSNLGTSVGGTPQAPIVSQFGSKPFGSKFALSKFQTSQNEKSTVSQFGHTTGVKGQIAQQSTGFNKQPLGSSQIKDSTFTQTTFNSTFGSQYGQKPQSNVDTSIGTTSQTPSVSQFGSKPFGSQSALSSFQTVQNEKSTVSQFSQTTDIKGHTSQPSTDFGKQPFGSSLNKDSTFTQTTFSSRFGSQYGQKPQSNLGTSVGGTPQAPIVSQFGSKPFGSQSALGTFQTSQNEKSSVSQFGQTTGVKSQTAQQTSDFGKIPLGSSQTKDSTVTQSTFSSTFGSQYGQKPQSNVDTSISTNPQAPIVSQFGGKPFRSQTALNSFQTALNEKSTMSQFGQTTGTKGQTAQQTIGFGKQPFGSSQNEDGSFTQSTFSSTFGSQYGQKPQSNLGTSVGGTPQAPIVSQFGIKPFGSQSALSTFQTSQNEKSTVSQFGQTTGVKGQTAQQTIGFGKQPLGLSQNKDDSFTQTTFSSTFGSQYGQKPQSNSGTSVGGKPQTPIVSQFGRKPFGSQSALSTFQTSQNEKSIVSQFGHTTGVKGQTTQQTTGFGKLPFGSSQNKEGSFSQTSFSSTSGYRYGPKSEYKPGFSTMAALVPLVSEFTSKQFNVGSKLFGTQYGTELTESQTEKNIKSELVQSHFNQDLDLKSQRFDSDLKEKTLSSETYQTPNSQSNIQIASAHQTRDEKIRQPFISTQSRLLSGTNFVHRQPQNSASAFASTSDSLQTGHTSKYQFTKFGKEKIEPLTSNNRSIIHQEPAVFNNQEAAVKLIDELKLSKTPSNFPTFGQRQDSSHFGDELTGLTLGKIENIPATQIDQLRSTTSTSNSAVSPSSAAFSQKSSQLSESLSGDKVLKSKEFTRFDIKSTEENLKSGTFSAQSSTPSISNDGSLKTYVGNKEIFEAFRHPPRFSVETGYHY